MQYDYTLFAFMCADSVCSPRRAAEFFPLPLPRHPFLRLCQTIGFWHARATRQLSRSSTELAHFIPFLRKLCRHLCLAPTIANSQNAAITNVCAFCWFRRGRGGAGAEHIAGERREHMWNAFLIAATRPTSASIV